ncbi:MAG: hypothetical protein JWQ17_6554 [Tardiphaga sp.]|jgi:hypothetical protein|nr:hypothetical protein [Tardiphaga sp.]
MPRVTAPAGFFNRFNEALQIDDGIAAAFHPTQLSPRDNGDWQ